VRDIARAAGLPVADKRESQDLCFLAGTSRERFLARHARIRETPGEVVDTDGVVLGRHPGHHRFTVGQRKGLGVAAGEPLYVVSKDPRANRVVVGSRHQLDTHTVRLEGTVLHRAHTRVDRVKLRYRSDPVRCRVVGGQIELDEPAAGVAPGQTACLMDGDRIVGHATIAA
jgi:tRNA-specific 2-thiouridylase